jgi:hypothetical protein
MSDWLDIHGLADEQLTAEEKARVNERLAGCEKSQRELRAIQAVKDTVGARRDTVTCEETWKRCQKRLDEMDKTHRIEGFVGRYAWAMCSLFLAFIIGAGILNRGKPSLGAVDVPRMAANMTPFLTSPASQDTNTQQSFLRANAIPAPNQQIARGSKVYIIQGARAVIDGRRLTRLDFQDGPGPRGQLILIGLEGTPIEGVEPVPGREGYFYAQVNDSNCVTWQEAGFTFVLQGWRSVDELCEFAERVCRP